MKKHRRPPLTTISAVIDALGGTSRAAEAIGCVPGAVSNYRTRGAFPPHKYLLISSLLSKRGYTVSAELFGFAEAAE